MPLHRESVFLPHGPRNSPVNRQIRSGPDPQFQHRVPGSFRNRPRCRSELPDPPPSDWHRQLRPDCGTATFRPVPQRRTRRPAKAVAAPTYPSSHPAAESPLPDHKVRLFQFQSRPTLRKFRRPPSEVTDWSLDRSANGHGNSSHHRSRRRSGREIRERAGCPRPRRGHELDRPSGHRKGAKPDCWQDLTRKRTRQADTASG